MSQSKVGIAEQVKESKDENVKEEKLSKVEDAKPEADRLPDREHKKNSHAHIKNELNSEQIKSKMSVVDNSFIQEIEEYASSDSDGSLVLNSSYIDQRRITIAPDFFTQLGDIPDISEISSFEIPYSVSRTSSKKIVEREVIDTGKFVDPLSGEFISNSDLSESSAEEFDEEVEEEVEEESVFEIFSGEDDDLLVWIRDDQQVEVKEKEPDEDYIFETFLEMKTDLVVAIKPEIDHESLERETIKRHLLVITIDFLSELIATVVETCEIVPPSVILRCNLDKTKLIEEIASKVAELNIEKRSHNFLNRKVVEHFKRKKAYRSILADNPDTVAYDIQKFKEATAHLDLLLGKEVDFKRINAEKIMNLNSEVSFREAEDRKKITDFEDMVKKILHRDTFAKLPAVVLNLLSSMYCQRDEVSDVRLTLIQRNNALNELIEKLKKLENIGDGFCMADFDYLQTETQALGLKIEEKNSELNRLRTRCNIELHIMAHMKEKQKMLRKTVSIQKNALEEILRQKKDAREHLFNLKIKQDTIRKEINELNFQGGLLHNPVLMFDYDITVDQIKNLQNKVTQYKTNYAELQRKIKNLESNYV